MATISQKEWNKYISRLRQINDTAADEFWDIVVDRGGYGNIERQKLIDIAYGLSTKYGEASAALSAEMYDALAELSGVTVPTAIPAETASYSEVAKIVNGIIKNTNNGKIVAQGIGRLVKRAGTDTILSNAYRDRPKGKGSKRRHSGAQVAWIPYGDTCPFCIMLASKGWQNQTEWGANSHSEHIHANCDCTYAVRFNDSVKFDGYDPDKYKKIYDDAEGSTREAKLNSMRRAKMDDPEYRLKINAQKRADYAEKKAIKLAQSASDSTKPKNLIDVFEGFKPLELSKEETESLNKLNTLAKKDNNEHGLAFYKGGNTEIQTDHNHNNVVIKYPKDAQNVELLHCHTDESPLSRRDLGGLVGENVDKTHVISINGDVWSASVGNGIKPTQKEFDDIADMCYNEAIRTVMSSPDYSAWSEQERYYMLVREQMYRIGNALEWDISGGKLDG